MPRVLFVAYAYPPVGGVGVQRVLKWTKFLPEFGWQCSVLTVANPSVPIVDESLARQIPEGTTIVTARTREPSYQTKLAAAGPSESPSPLARAKSLVKRPAIAAARRLLQPDPQILWYRDAVRVGRQFLTEQPHDCIVATAPPFSSLLLGRTLARHSELPLVVDYRDEWDLSNRHWENKKPGPIALEVQRRMQDAALKSADLILSTSPGSAGELRRRADQAGASAPSEFIYNGYDPDDFPAVDPNAQREDFGHGTDRFRLTFAGTLWALNTIAPLADAVDKLDSAIRSRLELVLVGRRLDDEEARVDRIEQAGVAVSRVGFVEHSRALRMMQQSDALLAQTVPAEGTERVISAKTFEYLAAGRPVLLVAKPGDQCELIERDPRSRTVDPERPDEIAAALGDLIAAGATDELAPPADLHRREGARQLADRLATLVAAPAESATPAGV